MPCAFNELDEPEGGAPPRCPFDDELIAFDGADWCPVHLPLRGRDAAPSPKADWSEARHTELVGRVLETACRAAQADAAVDLRRIVLVAPIDFRAVSTLAGCTLDSSGAELHGLVSFRGMELGSARFRGCRFLGGADFGEARFSETTEFSDCEFGRTGTRAHGRGGRAAAVVPEGLPPVTADVDFEQAEFAGAAAFRGVRFRGDARFGGARFRGGADFGGAEFAGSAHFSQSIFSGHAGFVEARFGTGRAPLRSKLSPGRTTEDAAFFEGAHFGDNAMFGDATFHCDALFDRATINGEPYFKRTRLEAGVLLRGMTLQGTLRFDHARLQGRLLTAGQATSTVVLEQADLTGVDARGTDLSKANIAGARFRDANLQDADLVQARNALADQFAGADVSGAKLPPDIAGFGALDFVEDASRYARSVFVFLLAGCAYAWLSIATTEDAALLTNTGASQLPIINVAVPVAGFYWAAPALLLLMYLYFHLYLQRLWEALARLPAVLPDGRPLHQRAHPWMLNGLVRAHFARLRAHRPLYAYIEHAVSVLLAWWLVPFTLVLFWARYLSRHDWAGTLVHVLMIVVSAAVAALALRLCRDTLRGVPPAGLDAALPVLGRRLAESAALACLLVAMSWGAIDGAPSGAEDGALARLVPSALETGFGRAPFANLVDAEVSVKPAGWTGLEDGADLEAQMARVKKALLAGADLRHARAAGAFLVRADLRGADLRGADLRGADLRGAVLHGARLERADLRGARLALADLTAASLSGADLRGVASLDCVALDRASGWRQARRDAALACGAPVAPGE